MVVNKITNLECSSEFLINFFCYLLNLIFKYPILCLKINVIFLKTVYCDSILSVTMIQKGRQFYKVLTHRFKSFN